MDIDFTCIERRGQAPLFLIDQDIHYTLCYARKSAHASINTFLADDRDAEVMARLMRTRKNNKRARAYADDIGAR